MSQTDETAGERSTVHSTFALERTYEAAPARVWQTWADPAEKRRWFGPQGPAKAEHELEFRVGGLERMTVQIARRRLQVHRALPGHRRGRAVRAHV